MCHLSLSPLFDNATCRSAKRRAECQSFAVRSIKQILTGFQIPPKPQFLVTNGVCFLAPVALNECQGYSKQYQSVESSGISNHTKFEQNRYVDDRTHDNVSFMMKSTKRHSFSYSKVISRCSTQIASAQQSISS